MKELYYGLVIVDVVKDDKKKLKEKKEVHEQILRVSLQTTV